MQHTDHRNHGGDGHTCNRQKNISILGNKLRALVVHPLDLTGQPMKPTTGSSCELYFVWKSVKPATHPSGAMVVLVLVKSGLQKIVT